MTAKVTMMLCDAAQEQNGKLFILGGGWSILHKAGPVTMGIAIKIEFPWGDANRPHSLLLELLTEDGQPVLVGDGPVRVEGGLEVGRPPGLRPGSDLDAALALNFAGVPLSEGGYRWQFSLDGEPASSISFQVRDAQGAQAQPPR